MKRTLGFLTLLIGPSVFLSFLGAQSVQELGFPNPAVVELVFPQIVFGTSSAGKLATDIVVVNTSEHDAYVEFDLFDPLGNVPRLFFTRVSSPWGGRWSTSVPANSIRNLDYPPAPVGELVGPVFVGWGIFRSNENVIVYQRIKVLDPDTNQLASEISFPASPRALSTEFPVFMNAGFPKFNTGISVVNPSSSKALRLNVQLLDGERKLVQERQIELGPRAQRAIVASDFFAIRNDSIGFARLAPDPPDSFAFTVLDYALDSLYSRRRDLLTLFLLARFDRITSEKRFFVETASEPWNFAVPVTQILPMQDVHIFLTRFAFFLSTVDGAKLGPFKLNQGSQIKANPQAGIAVVAGEPDKAMLFVDRRKVIYELMQGEIRHILDFSDKGQAEVRSSWIVSFGCCVAGFSKYVLIDKGKGEIIARFISAGDRPPPWRN